MAIGIDQLKFFASERLTQNSDGGGRMSATEIVSGVENSIFSDISDVARAAGSVHIAKIYAAVTSADTDVYLDASVAIFRPPDDPAASVLMMSTGSFYDERGDIKNRLEQTISRGVRWNGWLWGTHLVGQRAVMLWQRPENEIPPVGARLEVIELQSQVELYSQFLWITRVTENLRTQYDSIGPYQIREVVLEIAEPLTENYTGIEPTRTDPTSLSALVHATRYNADTVPLCGVMPLVESASVNDYSVKVASLYAPIIPTSTRETAFPDVNPGGDSPTLVSGNATTISFATTLETIKPGASLYLGTGAKPGTISISVSGATITDDNGVMKLTDSEIGTVDYGNGVLNFNSSCPNYGTASKSVTFRPSARLLRVADTASQLVTAENRGFVWVITLVPIPSPKTLRVSYRVNNVWYVIEDKGGGSIRGVDSSYGSGTLNFGTGTVTITTGALPDVDSEIIYSWGTPANYTSRGGDAVDAPVVSGTTAHAGVAPGSVSVSWSTFALTDADSDGVLTGTGGVGFIRYATGEWWVRTTTVPAVSTEFEISYDYGDPVEETFSHPIREGNGHLALTLGADPRENTVEVEWNLMIEDYEAAYSTVETFIPPPFRRIDPIKIVKDNGAGVLTISGGTNGTVNYSAGTVDFLPDVTVSIPKPLYSKHLLGTKVTHPAGGGTLTVNTYRTLFDGLEYIPAGAIYPNDETGLVKVRYREVGGDTSATETLTLSQLEFDLTKGYGETITAGSTRFLFGASLYVDTAGQLYRNPSPSTGAGSLCGTIDRSSGRVRISSWPAGGGNAITLQSLVTELAGQPVDECTFRTPVSPIKSGTLQCRYQLLTGTTKSKTVDGSGLLVDSDCEIQVDYPLGVVHARFGLWKVDSELTTDEKLEPWYSTDARINFAGTLKIWKPAPVLADSILYNAVAQTFLPPDSALLGIDAARLPQDGKGLITRVGQLVLVHNTQSLAENTLSPTQVIDCGRVRLYRVVIEDADGLRLSPEQYTVDREQGTVTMSPTLSLSSAPTAPWAVKHTVADMARIVETDINGTVTLNRPASHAYPADTSMLSGLMYIGSMQARVTALFEQSTWTSVWQDTLIGSNPLAQYNDIQYPIHLTNAGAYPDRILVKFTSSTAFQVIGENLGIIGTGDINNDCGPLNSLTGVAYFTIDYRGWGSGWATGNCLRFNVVSASYPVDLIRAIQPSEPSEMDADSVDLLLVGNVNV